MAENTVILIYAVASGSCSSVGFVGATVGAGIGFFSGVFGLMIDSLLSVKMVTADGDIVEASETSNPDLFWGIRGAGVNYGIITSATYRLHKQANDGQVFYADLIYPASAKEGYFNALQALGANWPAQLGTCNAIFWEPNSNAVSPKGRRVILNRCA